MLHWPGQEFEVEALHGIPFFPIRVRRGGCGEIPARIGAQNDRRSHGSGGHRTKSNANSSGATRNDSFFYPRHPRNPRFFFWTADYADGADIETRTERLQGL